MISKIQLVAAITRANCEEKVKRAENFYSELEAVCRDCIKEQEKYKIVCFISLEEQKRKIKEELEEADRISYTDLTDDAMIPLRCNRCDKEKDVYLIHKREKTVEEEKEENKRIIKEALKAVNMTDKEINDILSSFNSSNPNHSRVVGGRERKPCEGRRSTNLPNGWRVELPQEKKVRHNVRGNNKYYTGIRRDRTAPIGFGRKHFGHSVGPVGCIHTGEINIQRGKEDMERERKEITAKSFFDEAEKKTREQLLGGEEGRNYHN